MTLLLLLHMSNFGTANYVASESVVPNLFTSRVVHYSLEIIFCSFQVTVLTSSSSNSVSGYLCIWLVGQHSLHAFESLKADVATNDAVLMELHNLPFEISSARFSWFHDHCCNMIYSWKFLFWSPL